MAASDSKKRGPPSKITAMKEKRRKLESGEAKPKPAAASKNVRLNELKWNEIDMPDKLDDYEGFFGLEELDGVDVVKDGSGKMSFVPQNSTFATDNDTAEHKGETIETNGQFGPEDDFEGFSDHEEAEPAATPKSIIKTKDVKSVKVDKTKDVKPAKGDKTKDGKPAKGDKKKPAKAAQPTKAAPAKSSAPKSAFDLIQDQSEEDMVDISAWKALDLSPDTLAGLSKLKFASPTPIQKATIPDIMSGNDVVGKASTGSGKTLAFGIPIFETYLDRKTERANARKKGVLAPLALVVSPTRE